MPPVVPGVVVPPPPQTQPVAGFGVQEVAPMCGGDVAVVPVDVAANEERAIVLYKPAEAARSLLLGPLRPDIDLRVSAAADWIHGLKGTCRCCLISNFVSLRCQFGFIMLELRIQFHSVMFSETDMGT